MRKPPGSKKKRLSRVILVLLLTALVSGCASEPESYESFALWPGFAEYYADRCSDDHDLSEGKDGLRSPYAETSERERELLHRYRPRIVIPPGGFYPIDFYRDYLPYTALKSYPEGETIHEQVTPNILNLYQQDTRYYLEFDYERYREDGLHVEYKPGEASPAPPSSVAYGRVYQESVPLHEADGSIVSLDLTFLKYNVVFAVSGLSARLPPLYAPALRLAGLDLDNWHDLDNFVAAHVVLLDDETPIAVILAQHNHHRTYLVGGDVDLPDDGRFRFDVALRSNEIYLSSESKKAVRHRTVQWSIDMKYLLSGEDPPAVRGYDTTRGVRAGGQEIDYTLQDDDREDIAMIDRAIDRRRMTIDYEMVPEYGGRSFLHDLRQVHRTFH